MFNPELIAQFTKLNKIEVTWLLVELLKTSKLDFVELAKIYTSHLEEENKKHVHSNATLGLMLSMYCATDNSSFGKTSRKHIYESGAYTENDGSIFGKQLGDEFNKKDES